MPYGTIAQIHQHAGQEVTLRGWLYNKRGSGKLKFLILRDGSGMIQCVAAKADLPEAVFADAERLTQESSVEITGWCKAEPRAPYVGHELQVTGIKVVHLAPPDYPISHKEHGPDFLLDHRHLWLRTPRQAALMRIRSEIEVGLHDFFGERGFVRVDAPIFTPNACEGTTTLFEVDYFDSTAFLSQSGQLYAEAAALALGKVYTFGPAFRAEKSKTRRHLTEFWMIEPEMAFCTLDENIALQEEMICYLVERVLTRRLPDLQTLERDVKKLEAITAPFPRISYDEAVEMLRSAEAKAFFEAHAQATGGAPHPWPFEWGGDFGAPDEAFLTSKFDRPLFVHRFPAQIKAFYMAPDPERPELALGADLLAPEGYGEIIGGGQRLDDYDLLLKRLEEHKLPREPFEWYLDLRRYGSVPHGGFGLGIERAVAWIAGIEHVRETSPFPRTIYRTYP